MVKPNCRLIFYDERDGVCLGDVDLRIMDESSVFSNFRVITTDNDPEPMKYFGGAQEFPIDVYELYQLEYTNS
jgi:hypothetical protein